MSPAADRLLRVHNVRALELFLANLASSARPPALAWATATVAVAADETVEPAVLILVLLKPRALLALGALHVFARLRVRSVMGRERNGYRVRVHVPFELLAGLGAALRAVTSACARVFRAARNRFGETLARVGWWG